MAQTTLVRMETSERSAELRMAHTSALLNELYLTHAVHLSRFMLKLTRNQEEADDLVQEVFLRLCQQESIPDHPKEWLNRTGYCLFIDQWRRKQRGYKLQLEQEAAFSHETPEQAVIDKEFESHVRKLIWRFKPRMRTAVYLRLYKETSYYEITKQLGCSENTVKSCIRRGKAQLGKWLSTEVI